MTYPSYSFVFIGEIILNPGVNGRAVLGSALDILTGALEIFISASLDGRIAVEDWTELLELKDKLEGRAPRKVSARDLVAQVRILTTRFPEAGHLFDLDRAQLRYLGEIREVRNSWAHGEEFSQEDLNRAIDTIGRFMRSIGLDDEAQSVVSEWSHRGLVVETFPESLEAVDQSPGEAVEFEITENIPRSTLVNSQAKIEIQHLKTINFAAIQSAKSTSGGRNIVEQISIALPGAGSNHFTVSVQLFSASGPLSEPADRILDLSANETVVLDLDVSPDAAKFLALDTRQSGYLLVQLKQDAAVIAEQRSDIALLPANHWQGSRPQVSAEMLAAFVQPQHPAIESLLSRAQDVLKERTGSSAINSFQGEDQEDSAARVDQIAEAIFDAMASSGIRYSNPPASWDVEDSGGQRVRNPQEVLEGKIGTCLDTTVVLAAALEAAGINSIVWLVDGHAFLAYCRFDGSMRVSSTDEFEAVSSLVHADMIRIVETTAVATERSASLKESSRRTRSNHVSSDAAEAGFNFAIDVKMCRLAGIYPLPARTSHDDGSVTVVSYTPTSTDSLAAFFQQKNEQSIAPKPGRKVFPPRVVQWKNQLLDLSLRNRLLNFSERARFPLGVPEEAVEAFEDLVNAGQVLELIPADRLGATDKDNFDSGFNLPPARRNDLLLKDRKVFTMAPEKSYATALRKMAFAAKTEQQESGSNNLYLAIGSLIWSVANKHQRSPLILVPVNLVAGGKSGNYRIELDSAGSSTPNFCLLEKLRKEFDLEIPGLEDPDLDASGLDVEKAFAAVGRALAEANLPFHVEKTVDLANLQFAKFRLWKDLDENWEEFAKSPLVKHLIESPAEVFVDPSSHNSDSEHVDLDELASRCPVPADASQLEAVSMAASGRTFVLEGPPGTGKSQTITNLLATAMTQGKRVLFVAEKRAALEVVQQRLDSVGLSPFTLDLHDKGAKINDVRRQIKESLEYELRTDEQGRSILDADLQSARRRLTKYADRLHEPNSTGFSAYSAHTQSLAIDAEVLPFKILPEFASRASIEEVDAIRRALYDVADAADIARPTKIHPWGFVSRPISEDGVADLAQAADNFTTALERTRAEASGSELSTILEHSSTPTLFETIADLLVGAVSAQILDQVKMDTWQQSLEKATQKTSELDRTNNLVGRVFTMEVFTLDLESLIKAAMEAASSGFLGLGRKKKLQALVSQLGTAWIGTDEDIAEIPVLLQGAHELSTRIEALRIELSELAGIEVSSDWLPFGVAAVEPITEQAGRLKLLAELRGRIRDEASPAVSEIVDNLLGSTGANHIAGALRLLSETWSSVITLTPGGSESLLDWAAGIPLVDRWRTADFPRGSGWDAQRELAAWNEFLTVLEPLREAFLFDARDELVRGEYPVDYARQGFEKGLAAAAMKERLSSTGLAAFDARAHELQISSFTEKSERMRQHMRWRLPQQIMEHRLDSYIMRGARFGLLGRKLGQKPGGLGVRGLMKDFGDIITTAMPCTLVSPDSVARFFPAESGMFDLVVFDEASQVRVADAVGAIGRGRAVVVVGDSKQMPPTSVASIGGIDEEDAPEELVVDEESILSECVQARIPRLWLSWHYRSQDESLIAFSNHLYYDNKLASFPAPRFVQASADVDGYGISLVRVDGHFYRSGEQGVETKLKRTNPIEARAIVDEITRRFELSPDSVPSLGVVTFNLQQRTLIESMIRDAADSRLAESLDDMDGLFVKNLENVQGDERDIILFSTAFSPNEKGILPLNFGPLNSPGGERRLNVAVTRARRQVVVFSSFSPEQLRAEESSSLGLKHLRSYLDLASKGPESIPSNNGSRARIDRHREEIAEALRNRGYVVRTNVGLSEFKIDLAISSKETPDVPLLAVLLDGEEWSERKTVGDRDGLPKQVLENVLQWPRTMRVWLPQWLSAQEAVCQQIDQMFEGARRDSANRELQIELDRELAAKRAEEQALKQNNLGEEDLVSVGAPSYASLNGSSETSVMDHGQTLVEPESLPPFDNVIDDGADVHTDAADEHSPEINDEVDDFDDVPEEDCQDTDDDDEEYQDRLKWDPLTFNPDEYDYDLFSPWYLGAEVGDISDLDRLKDADITKKIRDVAREVIEDEWPVKQDRLARFINNSFGLKRVSATRAKEVLKRLERGAYRTDKDGFVWPSSIEPSTWYAFRKFDESDGIPVTDISQLEISNAMAYCLKYDDGLTADELKERMKDYLGFSRMGPKVSAWLDQAIELGVKYGRLSRESEKIVPAGKWAEGTN
ncbi:DUF4011 domain-containing protein [Glutamicibacter soli]